MPYYYNIRNERLRMLVMASESIHGLSQEDTQKMIGQIAGLNEDAQEAMIGVLEDEQRQIAAAKRARGLTPEMELVRIDRDLVQMEEIRRDFESFVLVEKERAEADRAGAAEDILRKIA